MSHLPESVRESIEEAAGEQELGARIVSIEPVGGGCINHGARLAFDSGADTFVKWNASAPPGMFEAEAAGLDALRRAAAQTDSTLVVPTAIARGATPGGAWFLMDYVAPGRPAPTTSECLGRGLALLHSTAETERDFGHAHDNWIGSLPQSNRAHDSWAGFWAEERIGPQLELARREGACSDPVFDRLLSVVPDAVAGVLTPALLHGDLWSGNVFTSGDGMPVLIDPAVYRGDGEVDLAMTELFGGFDRRFYDAYAEVRPRSDAYESHRRALYQLYYLLVHVNLFGGGYEASARSAARRVVSSLG